MLNAEIQTRIRESVVGCDRKPSKWTPYLPARRRAAESHKSLRGDLIETVIVKLDVIENSGPDNLRDTLKARLARASDVSFAVAFVTQSGLNVLVQVLRTVAATGRVRFLTGLYQKVTEPTALRTLLRVQNETRGQLSVRLSMEPQFHRKLFLLSSSRYSTVIAGSSNLTRAGLTSGGELNLLLTMPKGAPALKKIMRAFNDDWEYRAVPLTADQIVRYEHNRPMAPEWPSYSREQLAKILGDPAHHTNATVERATCWRNSITGSVKKGTRQVISETTNWDDENWSWYSAGGAFIQSP